MLKIQFTNQRLPYFTLFYYSACNLCYKTIGLTRILYYCSNLFPSFEDNIKSLLEQRANMEAALSDVIQFEEALGNITDKPMDSNNLVSVKVDIFEENPLFLTNSSASNRTVLFQ